MPKLERRKKRSKNNNEIKKINERPKAPITKCYNKCIQTTATMHRAHTHTHNSKWENISTNEFDVDNGIKCKKSDKKTHPEKDHSTTQIFIINVCLVNICSQSRL